MPLGRCHSCGAVWENRYQPGFNEVCPQCDADMHCCLNCNLYDEYSHNHCKSPTTEWVADKTRRNFCEEFELAGVTEQKTHAEPTDSSRDQWKNLFRKS